MRRWLAILALWPGLALGIALDGSPVANTATGAAAASLPVSVTVSTSGGPRRIYALVTMVSQGGSSTDCSASVSGGGLTWTREAQARWWQRGAEIWSAPAPSQLTTQTITATASSNSSTMFGVGLTVVAYSSISATPGNKQTLTGDTVTPQVTLAGTAAGSSAIVAGTYYSSTTAPTFTGNITSAQSFTFNTGFGDARFFSGYLTSAGVGGSITVGASAPTPVGAAIVAMELIDSPSFAASPTASPTPASYTTAQTVTLSCASPSPTIRCTTDGSTATGASPICTSFALAYPGATVSAICQSSGLTDSAPAGFYYPIGHPWAATRYWGP